MSNEQKEDQKLKCCNCDEEEVIWDKSVKKWVCLACSYINTQYENL